MTIYASSVPTRAFGETPRFFMWADSQHELLAAMMEIEADWAFYKAPERETYWERTLITPEQLAHVVAIGARVTDFCGPAEWLAIRAGNTKHLAWIAKHRADLHATHQISHS